MKKKQTGGRAAIQKRKIRRRRLLALALILLLTVGTVVSVGLFFDVETIRVDGKSKIYTDEEILANTDIKVGDNIFSFSAKKEAAALWGKLPYLDSVQIRRELPHTVVIDVSESAYNLSLPYTGGALILSNSLKIAENANTVPEGYTEIYGLQPKSFAVGHQLETDAEGGTQYLQELIDALQMYDLLDRTTIINVQDRLNLSLVYDDRFFVMIGTASKIEYKVKMLHGLVTTKLSDTEKGSIDLSIAGKATYSPGEWVLPDDYKKLAEFA